MNSINVRKEIEDKLINRYVNNDEEWINVYIDYDKYIDVKIVSDSINNKREVKLYVEQIISNFEGYKIGMVRMYSVENANEYGIKKINIKQKPSTLVEAIDYLNNDYTTDNKNIFSSQVISFYSYKGGVGRTLSMIHTAYLLAKRGKNVLMLDLDIEAPSLQNIFKSDVKNLNYGLIDYIYNQMYEKGTDKNIHITDIYTKIEGSKSENMSGNLYVVPAGNLNNEYIYKLSKIQPNLVSRNNYIADLIKELESKQELNLDIVLIDSRTGINDWGAVSLIDISDKVIFFIYPNSENLEGTKELINLVDKSKDGNVSIIFSRVDQRGSKKAKSLFKKLKLSQEYREIIYDPSIAIANEFPIQKMLDNCDGICEMILEPEYLSLNKSYLALKSNERESMLNSLWQKFKSNNVVKSDEVNMDKINEDNIYLILSKSKSVLDKYIDSMPKNNVKFSIGNEGITIDYNNTIVDTTEFKKVESFLKKYSWDVLWNSYIINIINNQNKTIDELVDKEIDSYIDYISNNDIKDIYNQILDDQNKINKDMIDTSKLNLGIDDDLEGIAVNNTSIVIKNTEWLDYSSISNCLNELKLINTFFDKNDIRINIKLFKQDNKDNRDEKILNEFKSNILYLEWKESDIENYVINILLSDKSMFKDYINLMKKESEHIEHLVLDLFWGRKVNIENTHKKTLTYFCEKLTEKAKLNVIDANNVLSRAIEIEHSNDSYIDGRIISINSINTALNELV
ncbi:MAG: tyrosine-protein kinase family protein [Paraclostridium sp.]